MWLNIVLATFTFLFSMRTRRDRILKPIITIGIIQIVSVPTYLLLTHPALDQLLGQMLVTLIVSGPFVVGGGTIVTHLDQLQARLADLAMTDVLTGLNNRRAFYERSRQAHRGAGSGVVFIIDADHFKRINDRCGHAVGDLCLQSIGRRIRSVVRTTDVVGRIGGEEFAAYLPNASITVATAIGQALVDGIPVAIEADEAALIVTLSVGLAQGRRFDDLIAQADRALYRAKAEGRARLVVFDPICDSDPILSQMGDRAA